MRDLHVAFRAWRATQRDNAFAGACVRGTTNVITVTHFELTAYTGSTNAITSEEEGKTPTHRTRAFER